ncbi:hypothetical protein [Blastopirellula marina]|uniref:Uncharacterized protein n=1 Tax=Blastopirellula marina DSM 3645 TaxID=314230 RepID=A3ZUX5_9BACT|nr:hypothetical protein [Blastopirellula marina]EAQ79711.1 hypothetical protein DSM3645_24420 [Blastopirellula marina DSM 3645]
MNGTTTKTPQELLADQLTSATDGVLGFHFEPFWTMDDEQGQEIPATKGHTFYVCADVAGDIIDDWFCDLDGPILDQAIERFEQRACVLMDIINGLHDAQLEAVTVKGGEA